MLTLAWESAPSWQGCHPFLNLALAISWTFDLPVIIAHRSEIPRYIVDPRVCLSSSAFGLVDWACGWFPLPALFHWFRRRKSRGG